MVIFLYFKSMSIMKKWGYLVSLLILPFLNNCATGQGAVKANNALLECLAVAGQDTLTTLNECEGLCLNLLYPRKRGKFDFIGKKVAFFRGNVGTVPITKQFYLDNIRSAVTNTGSFTEDWPNNQLFIFEEHEATKVGYDAALFISCKKDLSKKDVIKRLKKYDKVRY
jgi:hypothetical protein